MLEIQHLFNLVHPHQNALTALSKPAALSLDICPGLRYSLILRFVCVTKGRLKNTISSSAHYNICFECIMQRKENSKTFAHHQILYPSFSPLFLPLSKFLTDCFLSQKPHNAIVRTIFNPFGFQEPHAFTSSISGNFLFTFCLALGCHFGSSLLVKLRL